MYDGLTQLLATMLRPLKSGISEIYQSKNKINILPLSPRNYFFSPFLIERHMLVRHKLMLSMSHKLRAAERAEEAREKAFTCAKRANVQVINYSCSVVN